MTFAWMEERLERVREGRQKWRWEQQKVGEERGREKVKRDLKIKMKEEMNNRMKEWK